LLKDEDDELCCLNKKTCRKEFKTLQTNKILAFHVIIEIMRNLLRRLDSNAETTKPNE
jgi:hypothetical protein